MPGIFGLVSLTEKPPSTSVVSGMQNYLHHRSAFLTDTFYQDEKICAGRCHTGIINTSPQPAHKDDAFAWLDGEFYNHGDFSVIASSENGDAFLLLQNYAADPSLNFLKIIDGVYSAVIYDRPRKKIFFITDRYGLQHLYWVKTKDHFAWATEYKAFLALPEFKPLIDINGLKEFLEYGYFIEDRTWFEGVSLIPPATILTVDLNNNKTSATKYWSWTDIKKLQGPIDEKEIEKEWGRLFSIAVERRCSPIDKTGITLSGGLDSRAILAAMPSRGQTIHAVTFGKKGCDDIRIAARVAAVKGAIHSIYELDNSSWLNANLSAVWCTDGEACFLDTYGNEFLSSFSEKMSICLNGIAGDAIHGGSYLGMKGQHFPDFHDPYGQQGRRYIRLVFWLDESFLHVRMPFYDNALIELSLSLPDNLRARSYIYKKTLLHNYPEFFRDIPWQKSGVPISYPEYAQKIISFGKRASSRILRKAKSFGLPLHDRRNFASQREKTIGEPGLSFFNKLFTNKNAYYPAYLDRAKVLKTWDLHKSGKDAIDMINRYATIEIWLQQVFSNTFRPQQDGFPLVKI
jgi:asparagine synthase (glutamine-hydrolysing)